MQKFLDVFKTSEGWSAILAAILGVFVAKGVLTEDVAKLVVSVIGGLLAVIFQRAVKKGIAGGVPFQPLNK